MTRHDRDDRLPQLSPEALETRRPQPLEELVEALQDRVHVDVGRARPGRAVRVNDACLADAVSESK